MLSCNAIGVPVWFTICWRKDADLNVQPLVAVDDVVAGIAGDGVAAVAAQDDVSTIKGRDAGAKHFLQALR